jgi:hypothetical protein
VADKPSEQAVGWWSGGDASGGITPAHTTQFLDLNHFSRENLILIRSKEPAFEYVPSKSWTVETSH